MKKHFKWCSLACMFLLMLYAPLSSYGQATSNASIQGYTPPPPDSEVDTTVTTIAGQPIAQSTGTGVQPLTNPLQSFEFLLSIAILLFGILTLFLIGLYRSHLSPMLIYKAILLTLIITCSIILVVGGYSNQQITGVSGILGGIAGYLIGRKDDKDTPAEEKIASPAPKNS